MPAFRELADELPVARERALYACATALIGQPAAIWLCLRAMNSLAVSTATAASRQ